MKKLVAATGCMLLLTCTAASASTTYNIHQPFWGSYPSLATIGTAVWQAQRQAAVDANPGNFHFLNGTVTVDWATKTVLDYALDMDITINGNAFVANFRPSDPGSTTFGGHNSTGNSDYVSLDMQTSWGPLVTFGADTDEQYTASLYFSIAHFLANDDLTLLMTSVLGQEFKEGCTAYNPYVGCTAMGGVYDYNPANANPTTRTYGGGYGIAEASATAAVPLPATLPLMAGALAIFGWSARRRNVKA